MEHSGNLYPHEEVHPVMGDTGYAVSAPPYSVGEVVSQWRQRLCSEDSMPNVVLVTNVETLSYCGGRGDLCALCRRYQKKVDFLVRHPTELVTFYGFARARKN